MPTLSREVELTFPSDLKIWKAIGTNSNRRLCERKTNARLTRLERLYGKKSTNEKRRRGEQVCPDHWSEIRRGSGPIPDRMRIWRTRDVDPGEKVTVYDLASMGCMVVQVGRRLVASLQA